MKLHWTKAATKDLEEIRDYSISNWGPRVAAQYLRDVTGIVEKATIETWRMRRLQDDWVIVSARKHLAVCKLDEENRSLIVARILHGAQDIVRHLPPEARSRPEEQSGK